MVILYHGNKQGFLLQSLDLTVGRITMKFRSIKVPHQKQAVKLSEINFCILKKEVVMEAC